MKPISVFLFLTCGLFWLSRGIQVQIGEFSFSFESVKLLKELMYATGDATNAALIKRDVAAVCNDTRLPEEFQPLCQSNSTKVVFARLEDVLTSPDTCEICINAACTGCV